MNLRWLRSGELLAGAGAVLVIVSLLEPWYERAGLQLDAWDTFGPTIALLLAATCAALALVASTFAERTVALPVSIAVWCVPIGLAALIAAVVRVFERPEHATSACVGAFLALAGAVAITLGAWLALRDERPSRYDPMRAELRPPP